MTRNVVIVGAGGRDFHNFNTVYRGRSDVHVVAFTAAQIPGIADRHYPASLAGDGYPDGIPIVAEEELADLIGREDVQEVVLAYSDLAYADVMHKASLAMAAGADFTLLGPAATQLRSTKPVLAVCAARTGCGKSQTTRHVGRLLLDAGLKVALVRHPMPYGDLEAMRVQRFATLEDIDASHPSIEEREEYEKPVEMGMIMYAGVDYGDILAQAQEEADVVIWDGGNNDFSFYEPDFLVTVVDPLRPGHEVSYYPGEVNVRMADVVVVNKVEEADETAVEEVVGNVRAVNPDATIVKAESPARLDEGPSLSGKRVLVIDDGPTITHGGMRYGAGLVAARNAGATDFVDPRPSAVGSLRDTFAKYTHIENVLPAMGYGDQQLAELGETIRAAECDVVVVGTPMDLQRLVDFGHPARHTTYEYADAGDPTLGSLVRKRLQEWGLIGR